MRRQKIKDSKLREKILSSASSLSHTQLGMLLSFLLFRASNCYSRQLCADCARAHTNIFVTKVPTTFFLSLSPHVFFSLQVSVCGIWYGNHMKNVFCRNWSCLPALSPPAQSTNDMFIFKIHITSFSRWPLPYIVDFFFPFSLSHGSLLSLLLIN